jgi:tetratricopeptide (TPR) repeat protein
MRDETTIATASEEATGEYGLFDIIDPLASKTRAALLSRDQLASEQDRPFGDITSNSRAAVILYYEAQEFEQQLNSTRAIELYERALQLDPDFYLAKQNLVFHMRGNNAYLEDTNVEALSPYEKLYHGGWRAIANGDWEEVLKIGDAILELRQGDWNGYNFKYVAEYFLGRYEESMGTCERAIRDGYRDYSGHLILNSNYVMIGMRPRDIVERYGNLLKQDPSDAMLKFWVAITYLVLNEDAKAEALLDSVFELYHDHDNLRKVASDTYVWRKSPDKEADYERAMSYLNEIEDLLVARRAETDSPSIEGRDRDWLLMGVPFSFRKGEVLLQQGDLDNAIAAYEQSVRLMPNHYNSYYRLGLAYDEAGEPDRAIANFEKYIGVTELNAYDATALGREDSCAASPVCHSISRPVAVADAQDRIARLQRRRTP